MFEPNAVHVKFAECVLNWWTWGELNSRLAQSFMHFSHMLMFCLSSLCYNKNNDLQEILWKCLTSSDSTPQGRSAK